MSDLSGDGHVYNVLFLCTKNAARSLMAESILTKDGKGRFRAFSAGAKPSGEAHPLALKTLAATGYPTGGLRSKDWHEFVAATAPEMDFVITVCDDAAGEECPVWPGQPLTAHWGIENPALAQGTDVEKERAFATSFHYLKNRIDAFASLPFQTLDRLSLHTHLTEIGKQDGATDVARAG